MAEEANASITRFPLLVDGTLGEAELVVTVPRRWGRWSSVGASFVVTDDGSVLFADPYSRRLMLAAPGADELLAFPPFDAVAPLGCALAGNAQGENEVWIAAYGGDVSASRVTLGTGALALVSLDEPPETIGWRAEPGVSGS
ncbi:MAG: hypothetical protein R2715_07650 [Ilumatobacteraceae bacterium]